MNGEEKEKIKISDYIADFLASKGVTHAYGIIGGVITHTFDSIFKHKGIKLVPTHHEQGAAIMADAQARISGKIGCVLVTSGPGVTNAITGTCCSYYDSIPVINISGQVGLGHLTGDDNVRQFGFQETQVPELVGSVVKYVVRLEKLEDIRYEFEKAYHLAVSGRPGPVWIDLPENLAWQFVDKEDFENPEIYRRYTPEPPHLPMDSEFSQKMDKVIELLEKAERPVIIVGNGVKLTKTEEKVLELIKRLKYPAAMTWATKELIPYNDPYVLEGFGISSERTGNFAVQNADLLLILGSRMDTHEAGPDYKKFSRKSKKVMVDIDKAELDKYEKRGMIGELILIHSDLNYFMDELLKREIKPNKIDGWLERIKSWKVKYPICLPEYRLEKEYVNPYVFMDELSKQVPEDSVIITDAGGNLTWTMQGHRIKKGQKLFSAFNHSPMGYSLPAAIGAAFETNKPVNCIIGDGGIMMNLQEMELIRHHNLPIRMYIFNNKGYGIIKHTQRTWMEGVYVATDPSNDVPLPDYNKIANCFGMDYLKINNHAQLESGLKLALSYTDKPIIIDVNLHSEQTMEPKLVSGLPIEDSMPLLSIEQLKEEMIVPLDPSSYEKRNLEVPTEVSE